MTLGEKKLWDAFRERGIRVRRQAPMGRYVADFQHRSARLVIEVDSPWHADPQSQLRDAERDAWFASQGYRVIRLSSDDAVTAPEDVVDRIVAEIQRPPPSPTLLPSREKGEEL